MKLGKLQTASPATMLKVKVAVTKSQTQKPQSRPIVSRGARKN